jgi:hypothetical protein
MIRKKLVLFSIGFAIIIFAFWITCFWKFFKGGPGSYSTAERWIVPKKQEEIIRAIMELKQEHPELELPNEQIPSYRVDRYWYFENFYYSDTKEKVEIYLRPTYDSSYTLLGFTAVKQYVDDKFIYVSIKYINEDYGYFENKRQIKKFKEKILKPIVRKLDIEREVLD